MDTSSLIQNPKEMNARYDRINIRDAISRITGKLQAARTCLNEHNYVSAKDLVIDSLLALAEISNLL